MQRESFLWQDCVSIQRVKLNDSRFCPDLTFSFCRHMLERNSVCFFCSAPFEGMLCTGAVC